MVICHSNRDSSTYEDAYWGARPPIKETLPEIVKLLKTVHDPYSRGKLVELLGECEDKSVLPLLKEELSHHEKDIREWAEASIESLNSNEKWQQ